MIKNAKICFAITQQELKDYLKFDIAPYKGFAGTYNFDQHGDIKESSWKVVQVR